MNYMKKVAVIGTVGVPANYGGFESLVENLIGEYKSADIEYTVFCSSIDQPQQMSEYKGAKLKYIPVHANGKYAPIYDSISMLRTIRGYDVVLMLGTAGAPFLPIFRMLTKSKIVVNIDGLDQFRGKFGKFTRWYIGWIKTIACKYADVIISDNKGIQDFVKLTYNRDSSLIAYGGDHVLMDMLPEHQVSILNKYNVNKSEYAISVCRIEPENNCHIILEAFAKSSIDLVYIGNWERSEYGKQLKQKYSSYSNIHILDPIYDLEILYALRNNSKLYVHGHSVGGTNPSLVEAMFFGRPIVAYDVVYNKETTNNLAYCFKTPDDIIQSLNQLYDNGSDVLKYAIENYKWQHIVNLYEQTYE